MAGVRPKVLAVAVGVAALVGLAGCDGGGDSDSAALTASESKYCSLVKQFKSKLPAVPKDSEPQEFTSLMAESMAKNAKYFEDLVKAAPDEIKANVEAAITALRRVATGDITAYEGLDLTKADQWEEDHCNRSN